MLALGKVPPRTHDLIVLQKVVGGIDERSRHLEEYCLALSDYAVAPRYPGWEDLVGNVDIDLAIGSAKAVLGSVLVWLELIDTP